MASREPRRRATWSRRRIAIVAVVVPGLTLYAAACATTAHPTPDWVKTRESAEDFERARETCKQQALTEVSDEYQNAVAAQAGAGSFFKCMANKGWRQAPRREAAPGEH